MQHSLLISSKVHAWVETDQTEMKKFKGSLMMIVIIRKANLELYWPTGLLYTTLTLATIMTQNRFILLLIAQTVLQYDHDTIVGFSFF